MKAFIVGTPFSLLLLVGPAFAESGPGTVSRHVINKIQQEIFVARLVEIETTQHRRYQWGMTFERVSDAERFHYAVQNDSPVAAALGFREWKHGQEGVADRIASAPTVLLMVDPYRGRRSQPEAPKSVVLGCFVIDKTVPNILLLQASQGSAAEQ